MYHMMKMMECGEPLGKAHETDEAKLVSLKSVFDLDNSVGILKDMPCGYYAERKAQDDEWSVRKQWAAQLGQFRIWRIEKMRFVCEKPINKRMLICIACGNGSFEYRIELSKTRRQRLC